MFEQKNKRNNDGQWLSSKSMLTDSFEHAQKYKTPD